MYDVQTVTSSALPYQGRYPCASLAYKGIYYVGTYAIAETWGRTTDEHSSIDDADLRACDRLRFRQPDRPIIWRPLPRRRKGHLGEN